MYLTTPTYILLTNSKKEKNSKNTVLKIVRIYNT